MACNLPLCGRIQAAILPSRPDTNVSQMQISMLKEGILLGPCQSHGNSPEDIIDLENRGPSKLLQFTSRIIHFDDCPKLCIGVCPLVGWVRIHAVVFGFLVVVPR